MNECSYSEMRQKYDSGMITEHEWRVFCFAWCWSAPRFSGQEGMIHDRVYNLLGNRFYMRRIDRVRRWFGLGSYEG